MLQPELFEFSYWFTPNPGPLSLGIVRTFFIFFGFFLVSSFGISFYRRRTRSPFDKAKTKIFEKLSQASSTMGALGLLWLFFAYETIPFFSGRYFFVAWMLGFFIWAYLIYNYVVYELPGSLSQQNKKQRFLKYLSKKK